MHIKRLFGIALLTTLAAGCTDRALGEFSSLEYRGDYEEGEEDKPKKCTYTIGYWKTHNVYAKQPKKQIPWPLPEDTMACGQSLYDWLHTPPKGDPDVILGHQTIGALLNLYQGAQFGDVEYAALQDALALLDPCDIADEDAAYAIELSEILDSFNNGELESPHCDDLADDEDD